MKKDFHNFLKKNGYNEWDSEYAIRHCDGSEEPCYVSRIVVCNGINTKEKVNKLIWFSARDAQRGILIFSVTELDTNHQIFREVAQEYIGATITECQSRHGNYKCWMICIPTFDK